MNLNTAFEKMFFKGGGRQVEVADRFYSEVLDFSRSLLDLFEIFTLIGCDDERTTRHECAMNCIEKFFGHNAPALVAPLRPRVGKEQTKK